MDQIYLDGKFRTSLVQVNSTKTHRGWFFPSVGREILRVSFQNRCSNAGWEDIVGSITYDKCDVIQFKQTHISKKRSTWKYDSIPIAQIIHNREFETIFQYDHC
jgi:hypothetical protein